MSDATDNVYTVCKDKAVYKYLNPCKESQDWTRCNNGDDEPCLQSYDFSDDKKWRSKTKACRTVPMSLRNELSGGASNDNYSWSKRTQRNNSKGLCDELVDWDISCDVCKFSWIKDTDVEADKWRGFSAMNRCMSAS